MRYPYTEHAASGLPNLKGEVRFVQAEDQHVTIHSPRQLCAMLHQAWANILFNRKFYDT